jgi:endonuclease YncB( thermonuclease family)
MKAEKLARFKKIGMWSDKDYISPGIWRKKKRSKK